MLEKIKYSLKMLIIYLKGIKKILNLMIASTMILLPGLKSAVNKKGFDLDFRCK